uniref:Isoform 2 of BRCA2 and CDKN1A-interacting protein n=1 Tax=Homo sapiens TaxID=9606 RepID=UPI0023BB1B65|nr:Chain C, Isoform 2 of BRCA2 and CDKN1A-interacting protein [Homo sapiens]8EQB_F Chain F, Isoform 2 of BRCA2 and CDKN1A-interacting protein [Homo sapiens]8EQB_I Chain I, Isoform 2 of BRCA2 and CDKN1A-interacting protein [Homo sapiens]8EQB_L Chain L, Isoform 2 of BRCA2 and CDKN1A-interacting protein [Homo sapiens]
GPGAPDEVIDEEVNIEFEAYSLSDNDYDGIKKLLQQLFLKAPVNTAELTDLLIQQNHIGSVIKQTDVEVFGFISLLNLTERKGTQCVEQIQELVLRFCEKNCEKSMVEQLDKFLNDTTKPVGLLLSERFINVPPQIALPMYQQLQKELAGAHRTNKPCGKCYFYLLISKTFVEAGKNNSAALMFANAEEEFFYEEQGKPEVLGGPDTRPVPIQHNGGSRGQVTALVSLKAGLIQSRSTLSDFQGTFMTVGIALS